MRMFLEFWSLEIFPRVKNLLQWNRQYSCYLHILVPYLYCVETSVLLHKLCQLLNAVKRSGCATSFQDKSARRNIILMFAIFCWPSLGYKHWAFWQNISIHLAVMRAGDYRAVHDRQHRHKATPGTHLDNYETKLTRQDAWKSHLC